MSRDFPLPLLDWSQYRHAYGNAHDVPVRWANFLEHSTERDLQPDLPSAICHQGDVYSATWLLVPLLVELALSHHPACAAAAEVLGSILMSTCDCAAKKAAAQEVASHLDAWKARFESVAHRKSFAWLALVVAVRAGDQETVTRVRRLAKAASGTPDEDYYEFVFWSVLEEHLGLHE